MTPRLVLTNLFGTVDWWQREKRWVNPLGVIVHNWTANERAEKQDGVFCDIMPGYTIPGTGRRPDYHRQKLGGRTGCMVLRSTYLRGTACLYIRLLMYSCVVGKHCGSLGVALAHLKQLVGLRQLLSSCKRNCVNHDCTRDRNPKYKPHRLTAGCVSLVLYLYTTPCTRALKSNGPHIMNIKLKGTTRHANRNHAVSSLAAWLFLFNSVRR